MVPIRTLRYLNTCTGIIYFDAGVSIRTSTTYMLYIHTYIPRGGRGFCTAVQRATYQARMQKHRKRHTNFTRNDVHNPDITGKTHNKYIYIYTWYEVQHITNTHPQRLPKRCCDICTKASLNKYVFPLSLN